MVRRQRAILAGVRRSKIAADLHEHIRRNWFGNPRQALVIKSESAIELALIKRGTREPEAAPANCRQSSDAEQRLVTLYFASSLTMNRLVPTYPIFLIRIYFKRVPKDFLCLRVVVICLA